MLWRTRCAFPYGTAWPHGALRNGTVVRSDARPVATCPCAQVGTGGDHTERLRGVETQQQRLEHSLAQQGVEQADRLRALQHGARASQDLQGKFAAQLEGYAAAMNGKLRLMGEERAESEARAAALREAAAASAARMDKLETQLLPVVEGSVVDLRGELQRKLGQAQAELEARRPSSSSVRFLPVPWYLVERASVVWSDLGVHLLVPHLRTARVF